MSREARVCSSSSVRLGIQTIFQMIQPKPLMRKVRTSRRHLLAEKRAIHGTWYTKYFFLEIKLFCLSR